MSRANPGRVVVVDGVRTPFARRKTDFAQLSAVDLGSLCVAELIHRTGIDRTGVDVIVYGQTIPTIGVPNIAREVGIRCGLPPTVDAYSVSRACATSYQAVVAAADAIRLGNAEIAIAGGADSTSDTPVVVSDGLRDALDAARQAHSVTDKARAFTKLRPADLVPRAPTLTEPSTGLTMGQSAEKMAKENDISRADQDEFAHLSHVRAAAAWNEGRFADEVMEVYVPADYRPVVQDNTIRFNSDLQRYASLKPAFDPEHGTITAGNSSPLTDGASAVLMMSEARADQLGVAPLGYVKSHGFAAVAPAGQLLIGPVKSTPIALQRGGVALGDMDLIDLHEAFAAQVLSVLQAFEVEGVGVVDRDILNVNGGSIALGHPFAATGTRQIVQTLNELKRRGGRLALCSACAAGGLAASLVVEAAA
jgi:acetyl-CoA acyltransferase